MITVLILNIVNTLLNVRYKTNTMYLTGYIYDSIVFLQNKPRITEMKKTLLLLTLVSSSAFVAVPSWANQYAVQLEASKSPDLNRYKDLGVHGNLYTVAADKGYTRTRLGPFENKNKALAVLYKVRASGYSDAFIAKHHGDDITSSSADLNTTRRHYDIENFDVKTLKEWNMLSAEQQANLVYLDGRLHVKNGDTFTPLQEITGNK